jgi:tetratricopeptide (TPR) repeat protein
MATLAKSLATFKELGDRTNEAKALNDIGIVEMHEGRYADALSLDERALGVFRELGEPYNQAEALASIGAVLRSQGRYPEALQSYQQALAIYRQIGAQAAASQATRNLESTRALVNGAASPSP